jgi:hypothetical protein
MKRSYLMIGVALVLTLAVTIAWSQVSAADNGLVRTTWPSAEDPGPPFYARIESSPPHFLSDGDWAAIVFYRDPGCVPAEFNLLRFFDAPVAFGCPLTVHGFSLWDEPFVGAPKIATSSGDGAVPVWFVPMDTADQAAQDGFLSIGELAGLEGLLIGHAEEFNEVLHPSPLPPELGGGGHPNPKLTLNANGQLEDGRRFNLHVSEVRGEVMSIQIQFR